MVEVLLTPSLEGHGHVIFTSRNRDLGRIGTLLEIPPMTTEEGVMLLLRGYNDSGIQKPHKDTALGIINRLGRLALAIDQAASYIKYKRMPLDRLSDFLVTFKAERSRILSYTPEKFWEYKKVQGEGEAEDISAFTTWEMSFQQLGSGNESWKKDAAHFLSLSAFFGPTSITESLLRSYQEMTGGEAEWTQIFSVVDGFEGDKCEGEINEDDEAKELSSGGKSHGIWDADRYWDVIAKANELSLLQSTSPGTDQQGASFSLHPLIRDWLQLRLKPKERQEYTQEAIGVLACCVRAYKAPSMTLDERAALITHMDVSMSNDEKFMESHNRLGRSIASCNRASWFARFYLDQGRYLMAEEIYRQVIETRRSILSERHPFTLNSMYGLALALDFQAKNEEAESLQRQTLTLRKTVLGEDHIDTLNSMSHLAGLLDSRCQYEESEKLHRQTLMLAGKILDKDHPNTLGFLNNLALALVNQKKYEESEFIYRELLKTIEMVSGKEDPEKLRIMGNLAKVLSNQNKHEEAERMCRSALMMEENVLGKEHPDTLVCMHGLAIILSRQRKYEEAEQHMRRALMLRELRLGEEHPDTLDSMEWLATILKDQGKYEEAEQHMRRTLMLRESVSGKEHPDTLDSMERLAWILKIQGKNEEAKQMIAETAS